MRICGNAIATLLWCVTLVSSSPSSSPLSTSNGGEPSCEQLKAMWRLSKRQSRAAELTNELPNYRDPFSYNAWQTHYPRLRNTAGMRFRPVYGKMVHRAPMDRALEEVARYWTTTGGLLGPSQGSGRRRGEGLGAARLPGGGVAGFTPHRGSFQHLKELVRTERARELQEQRAAEEAAARAAAMRSQPLWDTPRENGEDMRLPGGFVAPAARPGTRPGRRAIEHHLSEDAERDLLL